jgi:hypothetical protein
MYAIVPAISNASNHIVVIPVSSRSTQLEMIMIHPISFFHNQDGASFFHSSIQGFVPSSESVRLRNKNDYEMDGQQQ